MIISSQITDGNRDDIVKFIKKKKELGKFTVIDVGASASSWTSSIVDVVVDINPYMYQDNIKIFKFNINLPLEWKELEEYIKINGKFDFSICSHTLEDISNPKFVCQKLSEISKEGFIAVPSKFRELAIFEDQRYLYRGYIHHRWIFIINKLNKFIGFPKINYIDSNSIFDIIASTDNNISDLSFIWKDNIELDIINNDYLGPSIESVKSYYNKLLDPNY
jgi:hypothetical protein